MTPVRKIPIGEEPAAATRTGGAIGATLLGTAGAATTVHGRVPGYRERPAAAAPRARRKHPSHGARVVALVSSVAATVGVGAALAKADKPSVAPAPALAAGATASTSTAAGSATPSTAASSTAASSTAASVATAAHYTSGTYTGPSVSMRWGDIQVSVTIQSGKIVSVQELQAPSDGKSLEINTGAKPILESEAVAAQGSNLNAVSGATYTSQAYKTSLQAALDRAAATAPPAG